MRPITLIAAIGAFASAFAFAQAPSTPADHAGHHPAAAAAATPKSQGEVRKLDRAQGKITLRHGPLENLDMPAMTMVFTVADKQLLQGLKAGDHVRFTAESRNGTLVVTALQAVR
jgi:Cu(I)/Ag(I) efflux system periplasmic protein CusF